MAVGHAELLCASYRDLICKLKQPAQNTSKNIKNIQEHINMNIKNILPNHREPSKLLIPIKNTISKYTSRTDR
uniref:Uncharacterized protein n=1 Tax=Oryza rufipogon TaxID=4529 RepID=A0A0E0PXJ6_ORYRU